MKLYCIAGPTASGKSDAALEIAGVLGASILVVDSMQVYRGLDIGTAKPNADERRRVPHFGIDLVGPTHQVSAYDFVTAADRCIADHTRSGRPLLVVGGTGLWLRALLFGLGPTVPASSEFRASVREREAADPGVSHRLLAEIDARRASALHPNDLVRIERALEIHHLTGRRPSEWNDEHGFRAPRHPHRVRWIRWDRAVLHDRIERRAAHMLAAGWIDEVDHLLASGVPADAAGLRALGYADVVAYLRGEVDRSTLLSRICAATRGLAKRQVTWFHSAPEATPIDGGPTVHRDLLQDARTFLEAKPE